MAVQLFYDEIAPADIELPGVRVPVIDPGCLIFDLRAAGPCGRGSAAEDVAALTAAATFLRNNGGGTLEVPLPPHGEYLFGQNDVVGLPPRTRVHGVGGKPVFRRASEPATPTAMFTYAPDEGGRAPAFVGLDFRGPHYGGTVSSIGTSYAIQIRSGTDGRVQDCDIDGFSLDAVNVNRLQAGEVIRNFRMTGCNVRNCYRGLFSIHGVLGVQVSMNVLEDLGGSAIVIDDLSGTVGWGPRPERVILSGNTIRRWGMFNPIAAVLVSAGVGPVVTGNVFEGVGGAGEVGLVFSTGGNDTVGIQQAVGGLLQGNTFLNVGGVNVSVQGGKGVLVGPNSFVNPGRDSGASKSVAVQLAPSATPTVGTQTHCRNCKVMGQLIVYEDGVSDELTIGIEVTNASQVDNEVLFNTVLAGTTRIDDGGARTLKAGNRVTEGEAPVFKLDGISEITNYLHLTRHSAQIRFDRPHTSAAQYEGLEFRTMNADGSANATPARLWYDYTNNRIVVYAPSGVRCAIDVTSGEVETFGLAVGLVSRSPDGTRYRLAPPNGGGAATWVAA